MVIYIEKNVLEWTPFFIKSIELIELNLWIFVSIGYKKECLKKSLWIKIELWSNIPKNCWRVMRELPVHSPNHQSYHIKS